MEKLRKGKWDYQMATKAEFDKAVAEIKGIVEKYGWQKKRIRPYSFMMELQELIDSDGWKNYDKYSHSSKCLLVGEVNGVIEILEAWVAVEEEPKVKVEMILGSKTIKEGSVVELPSSVAKDFVECGFARKID